MRFLLLVTIACVASHFTPASRAIGAEKPLQKKTKELLVGMWEDPERPGNGWKFEKDGRFTAEITAGVVHAHPTGTYRVLPDGSLEVQVRVGQVSAPPRRIMVTVTKDRLTFIDPDGKEERYRRAKCK